MKTQQWWQDRGALGRVVCDLLAGEFARLRPGGSPPDGSDPWLETFPLGQDGLGADSLDLLQLAAALNEALHLHRSGIEDYLLVRKTIGDWLDICQAALARFDGALSFRTSGSTGEAKRCEHALAALEEEAGALAAILSDGPEALRRIVSLVPAHHIYGFLFTVLLPGRLGVPVVSGRGASPGGLAARLLPGDLVVAHPDWWGALLRSGAALPAGVSGTSSTAPCPPATARGVRGIGLARLVEVFGSSETAGLGWRESPDAPFRPFAWWRFGEDGQVSRRLADGTLQTATLQDRLVHSTEGFRPAGRLDTVVQVGGVNVSLAAVQAHLSSHPDVEAAAVRPMRPEEGTRLKAFIVPAAGAPVRDELCRRLTKWIEATLPAPQRPRALRIGPALPVNAMGKPCDWLLTAEVAIEIATATDR
ncbi:4-coumarate--CoA ligase [Azospirillum sp. CT11-132]|uniref:4-coumarate--CoA ligase n=1 Tax=Azospirillum sp. CT11-132 TaxID=3396317 RepID=UPI0039A5E373